MFSVGNNGALSAIAASAVVNHRKTILGFCAVDIDVQTPAEVPPVARVHRSIDSLHEQNHKLPSSHAPPSIFFSPSSMNFALACVPKCEWRSRYRGRSPLVDFIWCRESRRLVEVSSSGTA